MLGDEDGLLDDDLEDEKALLEPTSEEDAILRTPTSLDTPIKHITSEPLDNIQKRVTLKRNVSISSSISSDIQKILSSDENSVKIDADDETAATDKKVIKLSGLTAQERLEMRIKKFGTPVSAGVKKTARAERFGIKSDENVNNKGTISALGSTTSLDKLKQRAERFGVSVSSVSSSENEQKLLKRQERFGVTAATTGIKSTAASMDYAERAKLRLERFKNN